MLVIKGDMLEYGWVFILISLFWLSNCYNDRLVWDLLLVKDFYIMTIINDKLFKKYS